MHKLQAGDVIEYWHELFVCGDKRGFRREKIVVINTNQDSWVVKCDNGDLLNGMQQVKRVMVNDCGTLKPHEGEWMCIEDCKLVESIEETYLQTGLTAAQRDHQ